MTFNFSCVFSGLCGFVSNMPLSSSPTRVRVLMAEGDIGAFREGLDAHYPMLQVPVKNLLSWSGSVRPFTVQRTASNPVVIFFLNNSECAFNFHGEGVPNQLVPNVTAVADLENPVGAERQSLLLVAQIEKGAPVAKKLASGCLSVPADRARVSARVLISEGDFFVRNLARSLDGASGMIVDEVWEFPAAHAPHRQVFAEDVVLAKQNLATTVEINAVSLLTGNPAFTVGVGPALGEDAVEITILNAELGSLLNLHPYNPDNTRATDIKLSYRLSTRWNGVDPTIGAVPIPVRVKGGGGRPVHCPRTFFESDAGA